MCILWMMHTLWAVDVSPESRRGMNWIPSVMAGVASAALMVGYMWQEDFYNNKACTVYEPDRLLLTIGAIAMKQWPILLASLGSLSLPCVTSHAWSFLPQENNFVLPADVIVNEPGVSYAVTLNGGRLPNWLTFNPQNFSLSGSPPGGQGQYMLQITSTTRSGQVKTTQLPLTFGVAVPPQVIGTVNPVPDAKIGQYFEHLIDTKRIFYDPDTQDYDDNLDTLSYSMIGLPRFLSFGQKNGTVYQLFGKPGRGDMNFIGDTAYSMLLKAENLGKASVTVPVDLKIQGDSTSTFTLKILAPIGTGLTLGFFLYRHHNRCINPVIKYKKLKHFRDVPYAKNDITIGQEFGPIFLTTKSHDVDHLQMFIETDKKWQPIPGGGLFPVWIKYNPEYNRLESTDTHPSCANTYIVEVKNRRKILKEIIWINVKCLDDCIV